VDVHWNGTGKCTRCQPGVVRTVWIRHQLEQGYRAVSRQIFIVAKVTVKHNYALPGNMCVNANVDKIPTILAWKTFMFECIFLDIVLHCNLLILRYCNISA